MRESDEEYPSEAFESCRCGARPTASVCPLAEGGWEAVVGCPECRGAFVKRRDPLMLGALNRARAAWNYVCTDYE